MGSPPDEFSTVREISDNPDEAATNTEDAYAALAEPVEMQVFFGDILKVSNHNDVFHVDNIDNNVDKLFNNEKEKIEELRELIVGSCYRRGVYNAIALHSLQNLLLSPGFLFLLEML